MDVSLFIVVLAEIGLLIGGVFGCLVGFRVYRGGKRGNRDDWDAYYNKGGYLFRFIGPYCLLLALVFPSIMGVGPTLPHPVPEVAVLALAGALVVFGACTWRKEPKVDWPRGFLGWLRFLWLEGLIYGAILAGVLSFLGLDLPSRGWPLVALWLAGLVVARTITVWLTRFKFHHQ